MSPELEAGTSFPDNEWVILGMELLSGQATSQGL